MKFSAIGDKGRKALERLRNRIHRRRLCASVLYRKANTRREVWILVIYQRKAD